MGGRKTTKKARRETRQVSGGRRQGAKAKPRPQQGGRFWLELLLPGAFEGSGVISHDVSR